MSATLLATLMVALLVGLMAKHGRRKYRRYLKGRIDIDLLLGTLAADDAISANNASVLVEQAYLTSVKATWTLSAYTGAQGDGPIICGVAHSGYTSAEIEEWIESTTSWDQGNLISQEVNRRKIRQVGAFSTTISVGDATALNEGKPISTKCGWQLDTGDTVKVWVYNSGTGALADLSSLNVTGHANLWPN